MSFKSDASIKSRYVKTNDKGEYSTTDNISVLSVASLSGGFFGLLICFVYSMQYTIAKVLILLLLVAIIHHRMLSTNI